MSRMVIKWLIKTVWHGHNNRQIVEQSREFRPKHIQQLIYENDVTSNQWGQDNLAINDAGQMDIQMEKYD